MTHAYRKLKDGRILCAAAEHFDSPGTFDIYAQIGRSKRKAYTKWCGSTLNAKRHNAHTQAVATAFRPPVLAAARRFEKSIAGTEDRIVTQGMGAT